MGTVIVILTLTTIIYLIRQIRRKNYENKQLRTSLDITFGIIREANVKNVPPKELGDKDLL